MLTNCDVGLRERDEGGRMCQAHITTKTTTKNDINLGFTTKTIGVGGVRVGGSGTGLGELFQKLNM